MHFIPNKYFEKLSAQEGVQFDTVIGQLIDAYLVVDKVGAGGFGKVYLGLQLPIMLEGAIKLMAPEDNRANAETMIRNFRQEAQSLARLTDPHIVKLQRYGVFHETPYMVMEYVNNSRTLKDEMDALASKGEKFSLKESSHIIHQILSGLKSTHRLQIIHRDIKPANIMLQRIEDDDLFVRIVDFGLAKLVEARTYTDTILGTPVYMAPEQITKVHIGPWTDLYAVGVIAFEMLTGRTPFKFRTFQELLGQKISPEYDPLEIIRDQDPPEGLKTFLTMALARKHEDRYKSVNEFRAGFDNALAELEIIDARTIGLDPFSRMAVTAGSDMGKQRIKEEKSRLEQEKKELLSQIQVLKETKNGIEAQNVEPAKEEPEQPVGVKTEIITDDNAEVRMPVDKSPVKANSEVDSDKSNEPKSDEPKTVGHETPKIQKNGKKSANATIFIILGVLVLLGALIFVFLKPFGGVVKKKEVKNVAIKPVESAKPVVKKAEIVKPVAKKVATKNVKKAAKKAVSKPVAVLKPKRAVKTENKKKTVKNVKKEKAALPKKTKHVKLSGAKQFKKACDTGNMKACYKLAIMYDDGRGGVKKDDTKAAGLYKKTCDAGNMKACYNLGMMYQHGEGVKKSYKKAAGLYTTACNRGQVHGCLGLGMLYVKGRGVRQDYNRASELFKAACDKGSDAGCRLYDKLEIIK